MSRSSLALFWLAAAGLAACEPVAPARPPPPLDSIGPRAVLVTDSAITISLWGEGFTESSVVRWGDVDLPTNYLGDDRLAAAVPGALLGAGDSVPITLGGGSQPSDTLWFLVVQPLEPRPHDTLAAGSGVTCGIAADGATVCWGSSAHHLGPDPAAGPLAMRPIADDPGFVHLTVGGAHACGLTADGIAHCWGLRSAALGTDAVADVPTPVHVDLEFADLDTETNLTCGVTKHGEAYCWGYEKTSGQFGDGAGSTTRSSYSPVRVALDVPLVSISVGRVSVCAIGKDARVYCWGQADILGRDPAEPLSTAPGPVAGDELYQDVAVANAHTCAITVHDDLYCWTAGTPRRVSSGPLVSVVDGASQLYCGRSPDDTGWCWGSVNFGSMGTMDPGQTPSPILDPGRFRHLDIGNAHFCGIGLDGRAYCWGRIGGGTGLTWYVAEPTPVATAQRFTSIDAGFGTTCALNTDARILCWGLGPFPVRGGGNTVESGPVPAAPGLAFRAISVGGREPSRYRRGYPPAQFPSTLCGIRTDGALSCWSAGSLNFDMSGDWAAVAQGADHGCAIDADGAVWCWGANDYGQLGDGTTSQRETPVAVAGGHEFREISVGWEHTCGITSADEAFCWGYNLEAAVGDGTTTHRYEPTAVAGGRSYVSIQATPGSGSCALTTSGEVDCWGRIPSRIEFDRTPESCTERVWSWTVPCFTTPARLNSGVGFNDLSLGFAVACGLTEPGGVYCWGPSLNADDSRPRSWISTPESVDESSTYLDLAVGISQICGVREDGVALCWGYNEEGLLLGVSGAPDPTKPTLVPGSFRF